MLDLVVVDALVVDGSGADRFPGWVGIEGGRIEEVGRGTDAPEAVRALDARGRIVAPGFVDVHNHSDLVPFVEPWMDSAIRQGVTTVVVGNCGASPWPRAGAREAASMIGVDAAELDVAWTGFGDYLDAVDATEPAANVAALVGHGAVREEVMEMDRRPPTPDELGLMRRLVARAVEEGALGLSTGLIYAPGMYAATEEVTALAEAVRPYGGIYVSHIRGEGEHLFAAVNEAIEIGRRARVPAHVSHLKCETEMAWGSADRLLGMFDGEDASADQYPYTAWGSVLWSLLPEWAPVRGLAATIADDATRARLVDVVENGEAGWQSSVKGVGWERIVIESTADERWNGVDVAAIAASMQVEPAEAMFRLLLDDPDTACIGHAMNEDDVRAIIAHPDVMVASDASAMSPEGPLGRFPVHPRNYGTFPRVLGGYARDLGLLTVEAAVRKMTTLPAERFGLADRGRIAAGRYADLVVFDPESIADTARFGAPHAFPIGIEAVIVNGRVAWDGARGERAGRAVRRV
jgi:N-acyl-D-amino-acid deacylase